MVGQGFYRSLTKRSNRRGNRICLPRVSPLKTSRRVGKSSRPRGKRNSARPLFHEKTWALILWGEDLFFSPVHRERVGKKVHDMGAPDTLGGNLAGKEWGGRESLGLKQKRRKGGGKDRGGVHIA